MLSKPGSRCCGECAGSHATREPRHADPPPPHGTKCRVRVLVPIPTAGHSPGLPAGPAAESEEGRPRRLRDGGGGGGGGGRRGGEARGSEPAGGTGTSPKPSSSSRVQAAGMALGVDGRGGGGGRGVVVHIPGAGQ